MNCPICASPAVPDALHPEVELYRCRSCGHRFSRLKPGIVTEHYGADYFERTHRNWFLNPNYRLFERLARLIGRESTANSLIDVGCGNGNLLRFLAARLPSRLELVGLDLMKNGATAGITFVQGDVISAELGRRFSIVVSLAVIEHLADPRLFVQRLISLAEPGGLVIVMTLDDGSLLYRSARLLHRLGIALPFDRLYDRHHLHHFNRASLSRLLQGEGLRVEKTMLHNTSLAAIDIPVSSRAARLILRAGVGSLFALGAISGQTYLQTVVCRRPPL